MVGFIPLLVLYPYWIPIWIGLEDAVPSMAMICNGAAKTQLHKAVETKWNIGRFLDSDIPGWGTKKKWTTMEDVPYRRVLVGGSAHLILTYFDIHLVIKMLKTIAQSVLRDLGEHCR